MPYRYIDGQMPFIGFGNAYQAGPIAATANLGLRFRLGQNLFVTATGGYFREENKLEDVITTVLPTLWGAGLEVGYNTPIGPIKVLGYWSDRFHETKYDLGMYISLGFDF